MDMQLDPQSQIVQETNLCSSAQRLSVAFLQMTRAVRKWRLWVMSLQVCVYKYIHIIYIYIYMFKSAEQNMHMYMSACHM